MDIATGENQATPEPSIGERVVESIEHAMEHLRNELNHIQEEFRDAPFVKRLGMALRMAAIRRKLHRLERAYATTQ